MLFLAFLLQEVSSAPVMTPPPFDMAPYYQGTLEIDQLGERDQMLIDPGHRYIMYGVKIKQAPGQWWFDKDQQFCVLPDPRPDVAKTAFCMVLQGRKTGDTWTQTFGDTKVVFTLKAGRPSLLQPVSH